MSSAVQVRLLWNKQKRDAVVRGDQYWMISESAKSRGGVSAAALHKKHRLAHFQPVLMSHGP